MSNLPAPITPPVGELGPPRTKALGTAEVLYGPLRPWMKRLAEWESSAAGQRISVSACLDAARFLAQAPISRPAVKALRNRPDYLAYREELAADALVRARKQLEGRAQEYLDVHYWALAAAKNADDYKEAAAIAGPMLDRLWPKREDQTDRQTVITVNLPGNGSVQQVVEGEYEEIHVTPQIPAKTS